MGQFNWNFNENVLIRIHYYIIECDYSTIMVYYSMLIIYFIILESVN